LLLVIAAMQKTVSFAIANLQKSQNLQRLIAIHVTKNLIVEQICSDTENSNTGIKYQNANRRVMANVNMKVIIAGNVLHSEKNNEVIKEQSDVMQKVCGMLETMTERIMKIEQNNTNKTT
jgi:hypothetical protein